MVVEEVINSSDISSALWPLVSSALSPLMTIFKIIGIALLVYIIYIIIKEILEWRRNKKIYLTYEKVLEIDRKLDELLKRTPKKEKILEKQEKNTGFFARLFGRREIEKENKEKKKK